MAGLNTTRDFDISFIEYDTTDDDLVFRYPLTTSPATANIVALGSGQSHDAAKGVIFTDATSGYQFELDQLYASTYQDWVNGFTMYLEVENGFFGRNFNPAATQLLISTVGAGTGFKLFKASSASFVSQINFDSTALTTRINDKQEGTGFHKVWVTGNYKSVKMYVDYHLVLSGNPADDISTTLFRDLFVGFQTASFGGNQSYYQRNFMFLSRSMIMPVDPLLTNVLIFGDSIANEGCYPQANQAILDSANTQVVDGRDTCMLPMIQKTLQEAGHFIGKRQITNYSVSGSGVDTSLADFLSEQITTSLTTNNETPSVAFIYIGTNDVSAGSPAFVVVDAAGDRDAAEGAQFKANYQTQITALIAAGCTYIIIGNIAPVDMDTSPTDFSTDVTTTWYQTKLAYYNELIKELEDDNAGVVYVVDINANFGGYGGWDVNDFKSDDRHPDVSGSGKIGVWLAQQLLSVGW